MNYAFPFGREGCNEEGNTCAYIRGCHGDAFKRILPVKAYHGGAMRITQDYLRPHIDEFIHEEQPAFKHLLMDQHAAFRLCCKHKNNTDQVRCEARPWCISNSKYRSIHKSFYLIRFLGRHDDIIIPPHQADTHTLKYSWDQAKAIVVHIFYGDL